MVDADRFSTGESVLDLHARDQSYHPRSRPEAVIWPLSATEVSGIVKYADEHRIPITGWGSGSSLEGNPIPVKHGIVLDFSQMNRILGIREEDFQADVEPGVVYQDLNAKLKHTGLFFPPDPGGPGHYRRDDCQQCQRHPHGILRLHQGLCFAIDGGDGQRRDRRNGNPIQQNLVRI